MRGKKKRLFEKEPSGKTRKKRGGTREKRIKKHKKTRAYFRYAARRSTKKLRDPFLTDDTEEETPQATPSKQPYGTRKAPFSAASSPT